MKYLRLLLVVTLLLILTIPTQTFANVDNTDNDKQISDNYIPEYVQELVKKQEAESQFQLPEVKAWEEDLDGTIKEVIPLSERPLSSMIGEVSIMAPPKDGFVYKFDRYIADSVKRNWTYKSAGTIRIRNTLSTSTQAHYTQQNTTTTKWSVAGEISGSATIGNSFLGAVESKLSISAGRDKSWTSGRTYGVKQKIPARTTAYVTAYAVGANTGGRIAYKKYSPSGTSLVGMYYETKGGTAISKNDASIEITAKEPIK
ncbi:hypothetical protein ACM26V_20480 [Salipaludibacillus sp. HK11]|uniref:hypothetical protein n=1 Tax=Salipaludibacillus sp. HK11 TaxID=3394320 RepID=UPI0039FCF538